ncbi:MAG: hypothetical protein B7733_10960 [Myxococcales bacterium FL481]|nr:MAG: hypothetical protein B7733_10960 [Myxococcales bacterium FL481]
MPRRNTQRRRRWFGRRRWLGSALVVAAVIAHAQCADEIKDRLGLGSEYIPDKDGHLRIATWNLGNFPRKTQDLERIAEWVERIDPDVLALQEIRDAEKLEQLLPEWDGAISERGGRGHQRVAVMWRPERISQVGGPREYDQVSLHGRVRPALSVYLRAGADGPDFHVVVVHLKAKPEGYAQRRQQWPELVRIVESLGDDPHEGDSDVVVLGDFNVTGDADRQPVKELAELGSAFGPLNVTQVPPRRPCSCYWDGERRDAIKEPSLLDLVWIRDLAEARPSELSTRAFAHCGRHACEPLRSTRHHPDPDYARVSDHCPVAVDLRWGTDDD